MIMLFLLFRLKVIQENQDLSKTVRLKLKIRMLSCCITSCTAVSPSSQTVLDEIIQTNFDIKFIQLHIKI